MSKFSLSRLSLAAIALGVSVGAHAQTAAQQTPAAGSTSTAPAASSQATLDAAFKQADTNQDGKLSNAELGQIPALTGKFADLDKNKDGTVSSDEFSAGVAVKGN